MPTVRCPTCRRSFDSASSEALPFCSVRCRLVDLGRWLDERHSVPVQKREDEDESDDIAADESE